jgi:GDP-mannose 6-dehydrogenase
MDLFVKDNKLNLSPYYLKPGFAYGGSCLPKEVRAVVQMAKDMDISLPLIQSLAPSNLDQISEVVRLLAPFKGKRIGIFGLTFKPATDDLRESPILEVLATLLENGEDVKVYDPNLHPSPHLRSQIDYLRRAHPRLNIVFDRLSDISACNAGELAVSSDVLVVSHATDLYRAAVCKRRKGQHVIDLARLFAKPPAQSEDATYQGIGW